MKRLSLALLGMLCAIASTTANAYCINASDVSFVPTPVVSNQDASVRLRMFAGVWFTQTASASVSGSTINVFAENGVNAGIPAPTSAIVIPMGSLSPGAYSVVVATRDYGGSGGTNFVVCPTVTVPLVVAGGAPDAIAASALSPLWLALMAALLALVGWVGLRRS
jgi:hypothetical protein